MVEAGDVSIYIHWPFCLSKCPYCDFNSHEARTIDHARWGRALEAELLWYRGRSDHTRVSTIFFGGGTPSLMDPAVTARLIEAVGKAWSLAGDVEITLEANPSTVESARFKDFKAAGINRLSMGIQALNDADLAFLGRPHSVAEALVALAVARTHFDRYSFDLIYARPGQSVAAWQAELTRALALAGGHLSVYQLTIEDGTAFAPRAARGDFILPDEDTQSAMFDITDEILGQAGLVPYEISNHAKPGQECRHNVNTWAGYDYIGIGPGAHGRLGRLATRQHRAPDVWLDRVERLGHATQEATELLVRERAEERVMTGLRLAAGIDATVFEALSGLRLDQVIDSQGLTHMIEGGFLVQTPERLVTTATGRLLLNGVTRALLG